MRLNLKLVRIGMNMEEATIVKWHKALGERFETGEAIYEIETEKVTQEVEASQAGTPAEIPLPEGQVAAVFRLHGREFDYRWQLEDALGGLSQEGRFRPKAKRNKLYNKRLDEKLENLYSLFSLQRPG